MRAFLAFLFVALVALGAGAIGYNIGVSHAVTTAAAAAGTPVVVAGGWNGGFFFWPFAIFLFPLFFFCFFGFLAFVFGGRRRFGPWGRYDSFGPSGEGWDSRRQWIADAHRRMHEEDAARAAGTTPSSGASTPPTGPTAS
jgi:hypothetical protein